MSTNMGCLRVRRIACIDLFSGVGGLSHGFVLEGIPVVAGIDVDAACRYPYETNNKANFLNRDIRTVTARDLTPFFDGSDVRVLAGCAPCQPFSTYTQKYPHGGTEKWGLLNEFARLVRESIPGIVTMENVPTIKKHSVFNDFVRTLEDLDYHVWHDVLDSSRYGVPQARKRLVLLASKLGQIRMIPPTHGVPITVREAIGSLASLKAGESDPRDELHVASRLSEKNLRRVRASVPGGTWRDWPEELVVACHREETGKTFPSVYGRMEWDKPAPTMTTQCYGLGNGRFGHPEQDRAISLREAAILQSFPSDYAFVSSGEKIHLKTLGRLIGNAVPVALGRAIARSINFHLQGLSQAG